MIVGISGQNFAFKIICTLTDFFHVGFSPINHGLKMFGILSAAKSLSMNDNLVLVIHQRLAVIALDGAVGGEH